MSEPGNRRSLVLCTTAALAVLLAGCSSGSGDPEAGCAPPKPAPAAETALIPAGLSFERIGTVTHVENSGANVTMTAVSTKPLDELTVLIQDAVTAAGYRPAGMDNEGFEAEVFFTSGSVAAGQAVVRKGECEGQWTIDLVLIDPKTVPSSTAAR
ncbi:hypothetical protein [Actinophytocola sp.]|uniref:hypothetical protein n=1 Tax=Actinophytocola sp. TaxID=1872138 RepID=UPI002D807BBD|nr:hypothetical protein [Actinophytocola sp.]HET9140832.1 hypothetical protein [Actinophytocola sp.]